MSKNHSRFSTVLGSQSGIPAVLAALDDIRHGRLRADRLGHGSRTCCSTRVVAARGCVGGRCRCGGWPAARIIHEGALGLCAMAKYFFIIFFLFSHGRRATVGNFARSRPSSSSFGHAIVAHPGRGAGSAAFGLTASSDMDRKRASIRREPPRTSEKKKIAERTRKRGRDCLHTNNSNKCYILLAHDLIRAVIWLDCLRR